MSNDYIRKADAIDDLHTQLMYRMGSDDMKRRLDDWVKTLPSADVVQVVHGRWLPIVSYNNTYKCSECGRLLVDITDGLKMVAKHYPYCHCGAKMDGERKE